MCKRKEKQREEQKKQITRRTSSRNVAITLYRHPVFCLKSTYSVKKYHFEVAIVHTLHI